MVASLFPVAYRAGAIAAGFRGGGTALGVGAAAGAALLSAHPQARGALNNAIGNVRAPSLADVAGAAAGAAAGFATQAAATALGALALRALAFSPWVLAALVALELLNRLLKSMPQLWPQSIPANWTIVCGASAGRLYNSGHFPQCANNTAISDGDINWGIATGILISWKNRTGTLAVPPFPGLYDELGRATRTPGTLPNVTPPRVVRRPMAGFGPKDKAKAPPEARGQASPLQEALDPMSRGPMRIGMHGAPVAIPYRLIPYRQRNPYRVEQTERGYRAPGTGIPIGRVIDAYMPTERKFGRPITDAIAIPISPGEVLPGVRVRPPLAVEIPWRSGARTRPIAPGHVFARAHAGTAESKVKMGMQPGSPAAKMVHLVTETDDFIEALWDSIPEECKRNRGYNFTKIEDKVWAIFDALKGPPRKDGAAGTECMKLSTALQYLVIEKVGDMVYGRAGKAMAQSNQQFGWIRAPLFMSRLAGTPDI